MTGPVTIVVMIGPESSAAPPPPGAGRFAPSPSGDLHLGNLRTAALAWLWARSSGRPFVLRVDDVDAERSSAAAADRQLGDLAALGVTGDGPVARQSATLDRYAAAVDSLARRGLVYECYCSRRDIREASRAPHAVPGRYPGTCRDLGEGERERRRAELAAAGRVPALRLRADCDRWSVREGFATADEEGRPVVDGVYRGPVDDMVVRRGGAAAQVTGREYAYNLAVVVDDALAGVGQVVRGRDLLSSAPRQAYLAHLLGLPEVGYVHVPLVLGPTGRRLAKRDGAVTLREMPGRDVGEQAREVLRWVVSTLRLGEAAEGVTRLEELVPVFGPGCVPPEDVVWRGSAAR